MNTGEIIRFCRSKSGMTLQEVALRCGVNAATISNMEHNSNCKVETFDRVLNARGYDIEVLPIDEGE